MNKLKVNCYSGQTYAERPKSFIWEGVEYEVEKIEKEWREPQERHFQVRTKDNKLFQLCYNEPQDQWSLSELIRS
jgi:tryptophan 2,3-dioxygenase